MGVGGFDHLFVADGAAGLDDGGDAGRRRRLDAVGEGEEGVGGHDGAPGLLAGGAGSEHDAGDAVGLTGTHAQQRLIPGEDDGVGLDVLGDAPGEAHVGGLFGGGTPLGDDLYVHLVVGDVVAALDEHSPNHAAVVHLAAGGRGSGADDPQVFLLAQEGQGIVVVFGGDDDLVEALAYLLGRGEGEAAVEGDDAAVGGDGVAGEGAPVGLDEVAVAGKSAGVGVLHDHHRRRAEVAGGVPGGVGVHDVVVGHLLAVELDGGGHPSRVGVEDALLGVEGGLLVGVLAVAGVEELVEADGQELGKGVVGAAQVLGDGGVVEGDVLECLLGETASLLPGELPLAQGGEHGRVVRRVDEDDDVGEVLGRRAQEGGAADIDVLQGVLEGDPGLGHGLDEGVEVDGDEVDGRDALSLQLLAVGGEVAAGEDAGVDGGVEGLDAAVEDLGEAGEVGDGLSGDAGGVEGVVGAAGAVDLDAEVGEATGEVDESGLVGDAENSLHRRF